MILVRTNYPYLRVEHHITRDVFRIQSRNNRMVQTMIGMPGSNFGEKITVVHVHFLQDEFIWTSCGCNTCFEM
jgi:hypothetical protein